MQELQKNEMSAGAKIENLGSFGLKILGISVEESQNVMFFA